MAKGKFGYSLKVRLVGERKFFGPGIARLLILVDQSGSLQTAASTMKMSYSKAWKIVRLAESEMGFSLMDRQVGGAGGGASQLTNAAKKFIEQYQKFEQEVDDSANILFQKYFGDEKFFENLKNISSLK